MSLFFVVLRAFLCALCAWSSVQHYRTALKHDADLDDTTFVRAAVCAFAWTFGACLVLVA